MLNRAQSRFIANQVIDNFRNDGYTDLIIYEEVNTPFGWIYKWAREMWIKTGDPNYVIYGGNPFLVDKNDGTIHDLTAGKSIEQFLLDYKYSKLNSEDHDFE